MTLLGNLGDQDGRIRGTASVEYSDHVHGSNVLVDVDGGPDEVIPEAIRYDPAAHGPEGRHRVVTLLTAALEVAGWRQIGPIVWGSDDARVRVERVRPAGADPAGAG